MSCAKTSIQKNEPSVDMTSMLDIVFIMLIFFIVTTSFTKENALDIDRPLKPDSPRTFERTITSILLSSDDTIIFEGLPVDSNNLQARLVAYLASNPNTPVMIQSHDNASVDQLMTIVDTVKLTTQETPVLASLR